MPSFPRVTYSGTTPGADANTYNLYNSVNDGGANGFATRGVHKFILDLKNSQAGTLKAYKSADRGVTWNQIYQSSVAAAAATGSNQFEFVVEPFADWKLDWVNGGVAQATWFVDMALSDQRGQVGSVQEATADASAAAADATANPTLVGRLAYLMGFNGATWDRVRTAVIAKTATATGLLNAISMLRYNASPPALTDGDLQLLQGDASGNLRIREMLQAGAEDNTLNVIYNLAVGVASATNANSSSDSAVVETNRVVKASPGRIYRLRGYNGNAAIRFIQIHNTTTLPADAQVPVFSQPAALTSGFDFDFGPMGKFFSTGITVCNSTTQATKTIGAADTWWNVEYK